MHAFCSKKPKNAKNKPIENEFSRFRAFFLALLCKLPIIVSMRHSPKFDGRIGYIIYPASFQDSNHDGIGDIPGIISRLDYLQDLGIDLLWICPLFQSPLDDNGYDVSSYYDINPVFGTNEDFRRLLEEAHRRNILVLVDFVLNHTSDEHPWFQKALSDPTSEERGYYFFRKGKRSEDGKLLPPNNWKGFFSTSTWENIEGTDDFYFHIFSKKMPDVDWENPKLRQQYYQIARHYLDMGVDGFRMDALAHLAKDRSFADSPLPTDPEGLVLDTSRYSNRPEVFAYLNEFRKEVFDHYDCLLVGEVGGDLTPEEALKYSSYEEGPIHMVFNFATVWCNGAYGSLDKKEEDIKTDVIEMKRRFLHWYQACDGKADMPLYWCNHDHPRVLSQYGSTKYRTEAGKALLTTLLFMYGTPFIYAGDEIGMSNVQYDKPEDFFSDRGNENETKVLRARGYSDEQIVKYLNRTSRINARTPMQWNRGPNAGFSDATPINKVNQNYLEGVNVEDEQREPYSLWGFYRYAIGMRKRRDIADLMKGRFEIIDMNHPDVFAYRHDGPSQIVCIANFRPYNVYFGFYDNISDILIHNYGDILFRDHVFELRPYEVFLLKV